MLLGYIAAFIFILLIFIFEVFKKNVLIKALSLGLATFVFYALLYNVTFNSDWDAYYNKYYEIAENSDLLFNIISSFYQAGGYDYSSVYQFHIILIGIGFFYFASRFSYSGIFSIICIYLFFQLIPVSNQIRYYVAFAFFLISVYNLIVRKNKISFGIFAILSLTSHLGILLMYPFLYVYYQISNKQYFQQLIVYSLIFAAFIYLVFSAFLIYINTFHFSSYFDQSWLSSFSGGLYNSTIWLIWIIYIYIRDKKISVSQSTEMEADVKYQFLYKLSLYSVIFYPASLVLQILCHRYMMGSLIVWVTFMVYSMKFEDSLLKRLGSISLFLGLITLTFFYHFILPRFLFGKSEIVELLIELFYSNTFFYNFF